MSDEGTNQNSSTTAVTSAGGAGSGSAAPQSGADSADPGQQTAASPYKGAALRKPVDKGAASRAYDRVLATRAGTTANSSPAAAAADAGSPAAGGEQALGAAKADGASTQAAAADGQGGKPEADGQRSDEGSAGASTVTAPADWPEEQRERFAKLPNDEARELVLGFHKDLHSGFSRAMNNLAQLRKGHENLFSAMERYQADPDTVSRLLDYDAKFQTDPKAVLSELAKAANVEVFFDRPLPEGAVPEFKTAAEMAEWAARQAEEKLRKEQAAEREKQEATRRREEARRALEAELAEARKADADFEQHRLAVFEKMAAAPGLSVADALALVRLPAMQKELETARAAQKELATLKAKIEQERKQATLPVNGVGGAGKAKANGEEHQSPAQRAAARAAARLAAQGVRT